jgi:hypothetical protein
MLCQNSSQQHALIFFPLNESDILANLRDCGDS